jgi:Sugar-specific transcriptional regulator TrmB
MIRVVDYVLLASAAVIVSAAVVLAFFLSRYRSLVNEANESTRLAKDVWDSMNSRFTVVDTRMIDLMARTEVLSAKLMSGQDQSPKSTVSTSASSISNVMPKVAQMPRATVAAPSSTGEGTETETRVLQLLLDGPKTSAQIRDGVERSREHTARLLKFLFDKGLVIRNSRNKPYVYELTDSGKSYLDSWSVGK